MDLKNELKNLNLQDIKVKNFYRVCRQKTLIKFGISFGSIVVFLIIYYSILNPIVNTKKAKLNDMNNKIEETNKFTQEIKGIKKK